MPYRTEYVEPEVAVSRGDVTVYHVYKNDNVDQGARTYWFTTDINGSDDDAGPTVFDVRHLSTYDAEGGWISRVLERAIDSGELTEDGIRTHEKKDEHGEDS